LESGSSTQLPGSAEQVVDFVSCSWLPWPKQSPFMHIWIYSNQGTGRRTSSRGRGICCGAGGAQLFYI